MQESIWANLLKQIFCCCVIQPKIFTLLTLARMRVQTDHICSSILTQRKENKRKLKTYSGVRHFANDSMLKAPRSVFPDSGSGWSEFWRICFPAQKTVAWLRRTRCTIRQAPRKCKRKQLRKITNKEVAVKNSSTKCLTILEKTFDF